MTKDEIKQIIKKVFFESRVYRDKNLTQDLARQGKLQISKDYTLTPEEQLAYVKMSPEEQRTFASMRLKQARREKPEEERMCLQCGRNRPIKKRDGSLGVYCQVCLDAVKNRRKELTKQRKSCVRCPNPPLPGKKLCQKCSDELAQTRIEAEKQGFCQRCKKVPAEPNEKGELTKFCKACMKIKVSLNQARKKYIKGWKSYGKDVLNVIKQQKRKPTDPGSGWVK